MSNVLIYDTEISQLHGLAK